MGHHNANLKGWDAPIILIPRYDRAPHYDLPHPFRFARPNNNKKYDPPSLLSLRHKTPRTFYMRQVCNRQPFLSSPAWAWASGPRASWSGLIQCRCRYSDWDWGQAFEELQKKVPHWTSSACCCWPDSPSGDESQRNLRWERTSTKQH